MNKTVVIAMAALGSVTALAQPPDSDGPESADAMQQRMQLMHEQMQRIQGAEDPEERHRLMHEHMESMHEGMMAMRESMQGHAEGREQQCPRGDTQCQVDRLQMQQQMMGQRIGMMQMMMEHMLEHMRLEGDMMERAGSGGEPDPEAHEEHHPDQ